MKEKNKISSYEEALKEKEIADAEFEQERYKLEQETQELRDQLLLQQFRLLGRGGVLQKKKRKGNNAARTHIRRNGKLVNGSTSREGYLQVIHLEKPDFDPIRLKSSYVRTVKHHAA